MPRFSLFSSVSTDGSRLPQRERCLSPFYLLRFCHRARPPSVLPTRPSSDASVSRGPDLGYQTGAVARTYQSSLIHLLPARSSSPGARHSQCRSRKRQLPYFVVSNLSWPEKRVDTRDPEEPELARLSQYASVSVIAFATFPVFNRLAGCCLVGSDLEVVCDRRLLQSSLDCLPSFLFGLVCNVFALAACSSSMWSYCTRLRRL